MEEAQKLVSCEYEYILWFLRSGKKKTLEFKDLTLNQEAFQTRISLLSSLSTLIEKAFHNNPQPFAHPIFRVLSPSLILALPPECQALINRGHVEIEEEKMNEMGITGNNILIHIEEMFAMRIILQNCLLPSESLFESNLEHASPPGFALIAELKLNHCLIGDDQITELLKAIKTANLLVRIMDFQHNCISCKGACALSQFMSNDKGIRVCKLGNNQIKDRGIKKIAQALEINPGIEGIWVQDNKYSTRGAKHFVCSLKKREKTLKQISINVEGCTKVFVKNLAAGLGKSKILLYLSLRRICMGDEFASMILSSLKDNNVLRELHMSFNEMALRASKEIKSLLQRCKDLEVLNIAFNDFSQGFKKFSAPMSKALKLNFVDLRCIQINDEAISELIMNLNANLANDRSQMRITLEGNEIAESTRHQIEVFNGSQNLIEIKA